MTMHSKILERVEKIEKAQRDGANSVREIAEKLNVTISQIYDSAKRYRIELPKYSNSKRGKLYAYKDKIISEYLSGVSARKIARKYNCSGNTILRFLQDNKIKLLPTSYLLKGPRKSIADKFSKEIISLYKKGYSLSEIAKTFKLTIAPVRRVLIINNIARRTSGFKFNRPSKLDRYKDELIKDYENGSSIAYLCKKYKSTYVGDYLRKLGIKTRSNLKNSEMKNFDKINNMINDYKNGDTLRNLAKKYKLQRQTIVSWLKRKGISIKNRSNALKIAYSKKPKEAFERVTDNLKRYYQTNTVWNKGKRHSILDINRDRIIELYKQGKSTGQISKIYNCSAQTVLKLLKRHGVFVKKIKNRDMSFLTKEEKRKKWIEGIKAARARQIIGPEHRKKLSEAWKTPEKQEFARRRIIKQYESGQFPRQSNTDIERILKGELVRRGYVENKDFIHQFGLYGKFSCDFCFPAAKLIIECYGDWHHVNPSTNDISKLHKIQIKTSNRDKGREAYIRKIDNGSWTLLKFWGSEIKSNVSKCVDKIEVALKRS